MHVGTTRSLEYASCPWPTRVMHACASREPYFRFSQRLSFEIFDLRTILDALGGIDFVFRTIERPFQHWNHDWNWVFSCKRTQLPTAVTSAGLTLDQVWWRALHAQSHMHRRRVQANCVKEWQWRRSRGAMLAQASLRRPAAIGHAADRSHPCSLRACARCGRHRCAVLRCWQP